ncbi:MAG: LPS assembly lipoprotein LptE [Pseudomonadota bacterium]
MWWSRPQQSCRAAFLLSGFLTALASCSFSPLYAPGGAGQALSGQIEIQDASNLQTYEITQALTRAFGPARMPEFRLTYQSRIVSEDAAITSGQEISRVNLIGTLRYSVRDLASGDIVTSGATNGFVGYSAAGDTVATNAARRDAEKRLATILADQTFAAVISDPALAVAAGVPQ